jgi:protein TonB
MILDPAAPDGAAIGTPHRPLFGAVSLSLLLHGVLVGLATLAWTHRAPGSTTVDQLLATDKLIWIGREGAGGETAGSPFTPRPPLRQAARADHNSRPAAMHGPPAEPPRDPILAIVIPDLPEAAGLHKLPGTVTALMIREAPGTEFGSDHQAGGLTGGRGRGVNGGERDGAGDSGAGSGSGTTPPSLVQQVRPAYTTAALHARAQGTVAVEAVVNLDGSVGDVRVLRSFDPSFGLDAEAVRAVKQWRFRPGSRRGRVVPMIVTIELTFSLR